MRVFRVFLFIFIGLAGTFRSRALGNPVSTEDRIRQELLSLGDNEFNADRAIEALKAEPREAVIKVFGDDLRADLHPPKNLLQAIGALDMVELAPEMIALAKHTENWTTISVLNRMAVLHAEFRPVFALLYKDLSKTSVNPVVRVALLDGLTSLHTASDSLAFDEALTSNNFQVRLAAVRNFLAARASLETADQLNRLHASLLAKPYQARLQALEAFARMPASEQRSLRSAVTPEVCAHETEAIVKKACRVIKAGR